MVFAVYKHRILVFYLFKKKKRQKKKQYVKKLKKSRIIRQEGP